MFSQKGYIGIFATAFIVILGVFFINSVSKYQKNTDKTQVTVTPLEEIKFCEDVSGSNTLSFTAPKDNATKCPDGPGGSYKSGGDYRNHFQGSTTYKLVRKNLPLNVEFFEEGSPHSVLASTAGIQTSLDATKYRLYFPEISGEIKLSGTGGTPYSRTRDCGDKSYETQNLLYFIDYGMAFALQLKDGQPVAIRGKDTEGNETNFYLVDLFKDEQRDPIPPEAFSCIASADSAISPQGVTIPNQQQSLDNKQLQLEYFLFDQQISQGAVLSGWRDTCKPAIYLYPPQKTAVNVKVYPQGFLTYTNPLYNPQTGWNVTAYPDGKLEHQITTYTTQNYDYLYYESKIKDALIQKPTEGWVIQSAANNPQSTDWFQPLERQFKTTLPELGLNSQQTQDFISYWKKALPYSAYYFVGVVSPQNVDLLEKLEITPKPDSINRVRIYFEALTEPKSVRSPVLKNKNQIANNKFTVVEWGGMVKLDKNHPFTCSQ